MLFLYLLVMVKIKLCVSHHIVFLEHIPFIFIPSTPYNLTRFNLISINHVDSDSLSSQVPSISNTLPCVRLICTNYFAGNDILLSNSPETPCSSIVPRVQPIHKYL